MSDQFDGGNWFIAAMLIFFMAIVHHCEFRRRRGMPCLGL